MRFTPVKLPVPSRKIPPAAGDAKVVIVPGYGMAQAQHAVRELAVQWKPVVPRWSTVFTRWVGRMPGHMNVLLAEAEVAYDKLVEMTEQSYLEDTDVVIVIGANDVTNPMAREAREAPSTVCQFSMDKAKNVVVIKRSRVRALPAC